MRAALKPFESSIDSADIAVRRHARTGRPTVAGTGALIGSNAIAATLPASAMALELAVLEI
jgi:hypothetical protein